MLIAIEGTDRTGKTTLARKIADRIGGKVIHAGPPTKCSIEEYETALDDYDPRSGEHLILDRWHVGEYVWPTVFHRKTDFDFQTRRHVEMFMTSRGVEVVRAWRKNITGHMKELVEWHEPLEPEWLLYANTRFETVLEGKSKFTWDFENSRESMIDDIIESASCKAESLLPIWDTVGPGFVTGTRYPKILLVGDELGPEKKDRIPPNDVPFAPYKSTSGHYLFSLRLPWDDIAVVNAHEGRTGFPRPLHNVWYAMGMPKIVALGQRAANAVGVLGIPYDEVPHPQYVRRFFHHKKDDYAKMILERAAC